MSTPLALSEFADLLPLADGFVWREQRNDELEGLGSAETLAIELASPLWAADIVLDWDEWPQARQLAARIRSLRGPTGTFLLTNPIAEYPAFDPDGAILGESEVTLLAIDEDNRRVKFDGLPEGYQLGWGDMGEITFGADPERRYLFEVHGAAEADAEGETELVAIHPAVWPGISTGATVNFKRPAAKVFIMPGTLREGRIRSAIVDGMSFSVLQRP